MQDVACTARQLKRLLSPSRSVCRRIDPVAILQAPGFDELRLAVTKTGAPTPHRDWWLMTSRYLSGGALGMHALGVYLLARLGPNQSASDWPDIFEAYSRMTPAIFRHEMERRNSRTIAPRVWQMGELRASLSALCNYRGAVYWFFPPDNFAVIARYVANDADGFIAFKKTVLVAVRDHNANLRESGSPVRLHEPECDHA